MSSLYSSSGASTSAGAGSAPRSRPPIRTLEPETAHERHRRQYELKRAYEHGRKQPVKPSRTELDVLKQKHQFVRSSNVDPATLSWEDQLALKYYNSLFREFALVNLKHYKTGQIALRWRTEPELLAGIGVLTCANLRCAHHEASPSILSSLESSSSFAGLPLDNDETPLVPVPLSETEMQFGYVEEGEKKSALVKVVLCRECGKRLRYGREKAREGRERRGVEAGGGRGEGKGKGKERERDEERERRERRRSDRRRDEEDGEEEQRKRKRSRHDEEERRDKGDEDDYRPSLPPDLHDQRRSSHRDSPSSRSRRRSASLDRDCRRESSHR
ncbi:hypothetical protein JCM8547_002063 [Rhodosporidiobolus lusitaniae]